MPDIKFATADVSAMKLGTTNVAKVMLGTTQVWPSAAVFPVIATTVTAVGTGLATHVVTMPGGITAGNLLMAFVSHDGSTPVTATAGGFTQVANVSIATPNHSLAVFAKVAAGGDTLTVAGAAQDFCLAVLRITGHGVTSVAADIKVATASAAAGTLSDPPSLDAGSSKKWLWLAVCAVDYITTTATITAMPSGYTQIANLISTTSTSTNGGLGLGSKEVEAQIEDPGTFTHTSRPWVAFTLAIPPA